MNSRDENTNSSKGRRRARYQQSVEARTDGLPDPGPVLYGTVVKLFQMKGFGFIQPDPGQTLPATDDGKDWFFHATAVKAENGLLGPRVFDRLTQGQRVSFTPGKEKDGRKKAIGVERISG